MRKKRSRTAMYESSDFKEPRPTTASLEAPLILDPRLVDKLDMSLLSKESLSVSLTRISLETTTATVIKNDCKQQISTIKSRARFASSIDFSLEPQSTVVKTINSSEVKRLDDNNNKNKNSVSLQHLSPVYCRGSRSPLSSSDVALYTKIGDNCSPIKKESEPCSSCGQTTQPERFHSHLKSFTALPVKSPFLMDTNISISVVSSRATAVGKGLPKDLAKFEQQVGSLSSEGKVSTEETVKKRSTYSATIHKMTKDKLTMSEKRKPKRVTCYICGREFGSASFPIHEPKCLQKWHRENKTLPRSLRRTIPQRPNFPIDHDNWNNAAWKQSQALLIPCRKCKRTFLPDRLVIHERNCRVLNKVNNTINNSNNNSRNSNCKP